MKLDLDAMLVQLARAQSQLRKHQSGHRAAGMRHLPWVPALLGSLAQESGWPGGLAISLRRKPHSQLPAPSEIIPATRSLIH